MFRILKFLHFARDSGIPDIPVRDAAKILLTKMNNGSEVSEIPGNEVSENLGNEVSENPGNEVSGNPGNEVSGNLVELLLLYRKLDRGIISYPLQR